MSYDMVNTYYATYTDVDRIPLHILNDKNTMCIKCKYTRGKYKTCKVKPEHMKSDSKSVGYSVVLINPTEDLTYLKLLGVELNIISDAKTIADLDALRTKKMFELMGNFHV